MTTVMRVLVVEDDYLIADDIAQALERAGTVVLGPVPSIAEAARIIRREEMEIAVLDLNVRDELVFPVADELKNLATPLVFFSAYDEVAIPSRFADAARISKSSGLDKLVGAVFEQHQIAVARNAGAPRITDLVPELRVFARSLAPTKAEADELVAGALEMALASIDATFTPWQGRPREELMRLVQLCHDQRSGSRP
ncbi:hypothetical protein OSH08_14195 [Kaistia geumhonensis]|uniref:DNA-binding response OmpR family regulator n=1 Tax=Kaistia geumhonensis TaxID=410839 RepID=A0ABU0M0Y7_9HYPH|nr:hypothetical protein [Kaistia geumhonensis]MCX5480162.1 hypothetical protein [Kaistia geumhonensis]MDQ0514609.1 DNA-binding response OmpR family regulator [Kaistia geumhonensis]